MMYMAIKTSWHPMPLFPHQQRLDPLSRSAEKHESSKVELSRAWEPSNSSGYLVLAVLWKKGIEVNIIGLSLRYINVCISDENGFYIWRLMGAYDFNEVLRQDEFQSNSSKHPNWHIDAFRKALNYCNLCDHAYEGCKLGLLRWSKHAFGSTNRNIEDIKNRLQFLKRGLISSAVKEKIKVFEGQLEELLNQEDVKWKQRSKLHWYKNGDRNTAYFHAHANKRRVRNTIRGLKIGLSNGVRM
ncbi:hypothetical protein ACH5RR_008416 [Cinchona calisaya]|uniref:Uncharacterized protein n=1 Tax=Cinchona calisaya TaxID=153742 RepID=A0ABD3ABI7_9GENT